MLDRGLYPARALRPSVTAWHRLNSFDDPRRLQAGMMFAVETCCPASDGVSAARIEEEVIVTPAGAQIITLFPAHELPIANRY